MIWAHDPSRPMFLFLPFTAPHWPNQFYQHHADVNHHIRSARRREYSGLVTQLDEAIRQIVEVVKRRGMWQNTLLWAFSDNGADITHGSSNWPFRGSKGTVCARHPPPFLFSACAC
eukprot:COSAG06_NODE_35754_length_456_cov_0.708683_1_plen_115_part_01